MWIAAANEWYHAERRVMSKRQRRSVRVKGRGPRCRRFESFGRMFLLLLCLFAHCITKKNIFAIENIFKGFFLKRTRLKIEGNVETAFEVTLCFKCFYGEYHPKSCKKNNKKM